MAKTEKKCRVRGCDVDVYVESKCYRHFKTEDRVKDSEGNKAQGLKTNAGKDGEQTLAYPAGVKAAEVNPDRKDSVAPNGNAVDTPDEDDK